MEFKPLENPWVKKIRLLTVYLVVSVFINIFLITATGYFTFSRSQEARRSLHPPCYEMTTSNAKALNHYFLLSFDELIKELGDKTLLQDGYTKRDLALACLVNYHFFDIEKAISGTLLQRRKMTFVHKEGGEIFDVMVFPGLIDRDYQMVLSFIQRHKYPLTAEGLFSELQKKKEDPSLIEAFFGTSEFYALFYAFNRSEARISREKLLAMLLEGNWQAIANFHKAPDGLRDFLKEYVALGSIEAASIWIAIEGDYLLRHLNDEGLVSLINAAQDQSLIVQLFLKKVLCSVRSDAVRKSAGLKLYALEGITPPVYDQREAMKKFLPTLFAIKEEPTAPVKEVSMVRRHKVQAGDSLWKIAKKYGVTIEDLKSENDLSSDQLKPGQELKVGQPLQGAKGDT